MKKILLFVVIFSQFQVLAQKEASIWYFGNHAGLDFNSGSPVALTDGQIDTNEGCASICDENGALLFYTDGVTVYDREHSIMPNGRGLRGDTSSTNSAIIIPKPESKDIYYIITTLPPSEGTGLRYSTVDMNLNNGLGSVTSEKNIVLIDAFVSERLSAIKHRNNKDYWFVAQETYTATIKTFKVTSQGVNTTPIISNVTDEYGAQGVFKFSPDGTKLAMATSGGVVQLFDFNAATGEVSNARYLVKIDKTIDKDIHYYGVEFSPNGKLLYTDEQDTHVYQFNLEAGSLDDIRNSKLVLATTVRVGPHNYGTIQLGPDGKIYVAKTRGEYIDVIENPDILGAGCNFKENEVYLNGGKSQYGLPPFIQSYFYTSFTYENQCFGEKTQFETGDDIDSVEWNFGDQFSGADNTSNEINPSHIFSSPGVYNVSLSAYKNGQASYHEAEVEIYEVPKVYTPNDILICDDDNDGYYSVDLTLQETFLLNGQDSNLFSINYFAGAENLGNDIKIENPEAYINDQPYTAQIMYAKVFNNRNSNCYEVVEFDFEVFESPKPSNSISNLSVCDDFSVGNDEDGMASFDLTEKSAEIFDGQLPNKFEIKYFLDNGYSNEILNPVNFINKSRVQTIYVQVYNKRKKDCEAFTSFDIEVFELPKINSFVQLKQCDDDNDGFSKFNLNEVVDKIQLKDTDLVNFYASFEGANQADLNDLIVNPANYTNELVSTSTIWARVENDHGCHRIAEIELIVATTLIPKDLIHNYYKCDGDFDGVEFFDLNDSKDAIEALFPTGQIPKISFYESLTDALEEVNSIRNISNYRNQNSPHYQELFVRVDSGLDNSCLGLGLHITLTVEKTPIANEVHIPVECDPDGDGLFEFDTSYIDDTLIGTQDNVEIKYFKETGEALPSPLPNPFVTGTQTVLARIENKSSLDPNGKCFDEILIEFKVEEAVRAYPVEDLIVCDDDFDGEVLFDTSEIEKELLKGQVGMLVSYFDKDNNPLPSPLPNPFNSNSTSILARVVNPINEICFDETIFNLKVLPKPYFELQEYAVICMTESPSLLLETFDAKDEYEYMWFDESGEYLAEVSFINVSKGGVYSVVAFSDDGCESFEKQVFVLESQAPFLSSNMISIVDDSNNNSITIDASRLGVGDYEFSLDNVGYQTEPYFEGIEAGIYKVYARDKNGCGHSFIEVSVIGYPKFFTPNNDGYNDFWNVKGINENFYPNSLINIFDRFGKLIAKIEPLSSGWDGTYNGEKLPATDYWFSVELIDSHGQTFNRKGHFSLVR